MATGSMETLSWPFPGWAWTQAHLLVLCLCGLGIWGRCVGGRSGEVACIRTLTLAGAACPKVAILVRRVPVGGPGIPHQTQAQKPRFSCGARLGECLSVATGWCSAMRCPRLSLFLPAGFSLSSAPASSSSPHAVLILSPGQLRDCFSSEVRGLEHAAHPS